MSTDVMEREEQGTDEEQGHRPQTRSTLTAKDIGKAARRSQLAFVAVHKEGQSALYCKYLREMDGYAWKTYGANASAPWQFTKADDFENEFTPYELVNINPLIEKLTAQEETIETQRQKILKMIEAAGARTMKRMKKLLVDE